eukprot:TRINITY_DN8024_c0_g1_i1.p1 TRINITY_DN8024_c0_g1~~TRINITY_DN8024_c0_g1_i1.p1  ORF type:complete len:797 (+),score=117.56 TRINITY_DN8024_c0_g1_i1:186-2393(+)
MSMTYTPVGSLRATLGADSVRGFTFFTEWLDSKGGFAVGNTTYRFNLVYVDDASNLTTVVQNYRTFLNDSRCQFLIGPMFSDFNIEVAIRVTEPASRLLVAHNTASDAFSKGRTKAFSVLPLGSKYMASALSEARVIGVKTLTVAVENIAVHLSSCGSLNTSLARDNDLVVRGSYPIPQNLGAAMAPDTVQNITDTANKLMNDQADAVLLCCYPANCKHIVATWKSKNYLPKLVLMNTFGFTDYLDWSDREYMAGVESWDSSTRYAADAYFGSMDDLLSKWKSRWPGFSLPFGSMNAIYSGIALMEAVKRAGSLNEADVTFALSRLDIETLKGRIAWSGDHSNLGLASFMQFQNGSMTTVGPLTARSAKLIYPIPSWDERQYVAKPYSLAAEWGVTVLFVVGILSNIVFGAILIKYWSNPVIRASSPIFLVVILVGTSILYSAVWVWMPSLATTASCHLRFWMLVVGFGLTFGSLFAKTWRVWVLYSNRTTEIFKISNSQLSLILGLVVAIEVILCVLVSAIGQPTQIFITQDPLRPALNIPVCSSNTPQTVLTIILGVYNGVIILVGIYLGYRVRVVPIAVFNESKVIAFAIYNASFFSVIMAILQASNAGDRTTLFVLMSLALFFGSFGTTAPLVISKYFMITKDKSHSSSGSSTSGRSSRTPHSPMSSMPMTSRVNSEGGTNNQAQEEKEKLMKKNESLKKRNKKLKAEVQELRQFVARMQNQESDSATSNN